jgi:hypothetical protein
MRLKLKAPPQPLESVEQEALFEWVAVMERQIPELALLHHIPNGGFRFKSTAAAMKRQGVRPGIPDLSLPVARGRFNGLYIELKRKGEGKATTDNQDWWISALRTEGYRAEVCEGWEAARDVLVEYLRLDMQHSMV